MSKAFTRESDDPIDDSPLPIRAPLPPGVKNYITAAGARRLREELAALLGTRSDSTDPTAKTANRGRDARIRQLQEIIGSLVVAEPPAAERDIVRFGATVTLQRPNETSTYRIVGVDETDLDRNEISWLTPLARSLLGRRTGERVRFRAPSGQEELIIQSVMYE